MPGSAVSFVPMPTDDESPVTDDAALGGRLRLMQPRRGHRVGHDAILLAAASGGQPGEHAVELGAGVGAAGLALALRVPGLTVTLVEIDPALVALAAENAALNGLAERVRSVALDIGSGARAFAAAGLGAGAASRVLMNPPFHDPARHNASPDPRRRLAHMAGSGLDLWVRCAARVLGPRGMLTLIWRADGLPDVLGALQARFGAITVLPVHPRPDAAAIRILVRAQKGSRMPLSLLSGLFLNDAAGRPSSAAEAVLREGAALPVASS
jgi:tRNA1(Val) A37 N6-methylase TrmN6